MSKSVNKIILIGNLSNNPEKREVQDSWVCEFGLATNRSWIEKSGEKKNEVEIHRIIAWNKLAELCEQMLKKGSKVYLEGRLIPRKWIDQNRIEREKSEIVISEMVLLDNKKDIGSPNH